MSEVQLDAQCSSEDISSQCVETEEAQFSASRSYRFSMFVITIVNGLTGGVVENIRVNFSHALGGHIFISGSDICDQGVVYLIADEQALLDSLAHYETSIESITRRSQAMPSLIFGSRQALQLVYGVDFSEEEKLLNSLVVTRRSAIDNITDEQTIILPRSVAERLGVEAGETILMRLETITGQRNVGEVVVAALIEDQRALRNLGVAYVNLSYLNSLSA